MRRVASNARAGVIVPGGGDTATPVNMAKRLALIRSAIDLQRKKVLDCGCGAGEYVAALAAEGADVWGIEHSPEKVAAFRKKHKHGERVLIGDLQSTGFPDESFDMALMNEVLEHVPDDRAALREAQRILRRGGMLFLFSPNRLYPFETHGVYWKNSGRMLPHYTPFVPYLPLRLGGRFFRYWARNYWPRQMRRLVADSGFKIVRTAYLWQTFENISGKQPAWMRGNSSVLRRISSWMEQIPLIRVLGVSQLIIAEKSAVTRE